MTETAPLRILGITGPIGCGKSTVAQITLDLGARKVLDADAVVHELMSPGTTVTHEVAAAFGEDVLCDDGSVDRELLGKMVFGNPDALRRLESIVHPAVRVRIFEVVEAHRRKEAGGVLVIEAIRLLDSPVAGLVDAVWLVTCSDEVQRRRLGELRGYSDAEIASRVAATPAFTTALPVTTIVNDGSLVDLSRHIETAWHELPA